MKNFKSLSGSELRNTVLFIILVHSGFYNKIPQTEYLLSNRNLSLTSLEAGKSKIVATA